ncbi:MAG: glycoside hydrolase family 3 C-terminal domain-containing protein [Lachnospiraceae bacterium]|nr:glycoside hydrolase family 3 C-terminal domain-containing protein [Lachnospiraceae bacterium]
MTIKRSGTQDIAERPYEIAHRQVARMAAAEGFVLLKNEDHVLPLKENSEIALFGAGALKTVKGGTGSGNVYARNIVNIRDGMAAAGFQITNQDWLDSYDEFYNASRQEWRERVWAKADELAKEAHGIGPLFEAYMITPFDIPAGDVPTTGSGDVAVFVLSRNAGEGADRRLEKGDYYLLDQEYDLIKAICSLYKNVVLIINAGGAVDMNFTDDFPNIRSILYISQPGQDGGNAVADVLLGKVAPSGKLTATWPFKYEDIPFAMEYSNLNGDLENDFYKQGIFVGYRYFDSFEKPVRYNFGFGLSYTDFDLSAEDIVLDREKVTVKVRVKNTGDMAGKEVVEVYVSCPQEKLQKEYRKLAGFAKTKLLAPGEEEIVSVSFCIRSLASFDEAASAYVLEEGIYGIFVGSSLEGSVFAGSLKLDADAITERVQHVCPVQKELNELTADPVIIQKLRGAWLDKVADYPSIDIKAADIAAKEDIYGRYDLAADDEDLALVKTLSREQLIKLCTGAFTSENDKGALGAAGWTAPGSAAQTSDCAEAEGIPVAILADGPAGVRLIQEYQVVNGKPIIPTLEESIEGGILLRGEKLVGEETWYQFTTAFPVGTLIAQTWNTDVMTQFGQAIGEEMEEYHIRFWLAPGMNIHRNPLCGRNFEYYSEDPLIAGIAAAAVTNGVQSFQGCGTTIKHYACNNQENNRMGVDAVVSERALREIYVKGFEIAIKKSQPMAIMTSYNLINGIHAANNYDICTKLARDEWDFQGVIMTDWTTTNHGPDCTAAGCVRAGNDLIMPGQQMDHDNLNAELDAGTLTIEEVQRTVVRLLKALKK